MKSIMHLFEELVKEKCNNDCVKVLHALEGKEDVSEFKLSDQLNMNINELRILLYKLTENNLVSSIRQKDKQKGWYVYYWTFNFRHARDLLIKHKEEKLNELKNKLENKEIPKYVCPHGCISMTLDNAMEIEFKCPECNSLLNLREVKYNEDVIRKKMQETEEDIEKVRHAVIVEVKDKKEKKIATKELKKKEAKKTVKKKQTKKIKTKEKIKSVKKIKSKKSVKKISKPEKKKVKKVKLEKKKVEKKPTKKKGIFNKLKKRIRF